MSDVIYQPVDFAEEAKVWHNNSEALAEFVCKRLVNRTNVYGQYLPIDERGKSSAKTVKAKLTSELVKQHFQARNKGDILGLHTTSEKNTCREVVIDIDHHGAPDSAIELQNTAGAIKLFKKLRALGLHVLLISSNGIGGFHIRIRFSKRIPAKLAYRLGQWLASDWKTLGLSEKPESFPKQPELTEGKCGNWVRLFGLHHTKDFYTKDYDGEQWLQGQAAIDFILASSANSSEQIPEAAKTFEGQPSVLEDVRAESHDDDDRPITKLLQSCKCVTRCGSGYLARCPAHNDVNPSLSIAEGEDGKVLLHCHTGCETEDIVEALSLEMKDLFCQTEAGKQRARDKKSCEALLSTVTRQTPAIDYQQQYKEYRSASTPKLLQELADALGVSPESLGDIQVGWCEASQRWSFPERNGRKQITGFLFRDRNGQKQIGTGGKRGLIIPRSFFKNPKNEPLLILEGASDTAAGLTMGWNVIGRPSVNGGVSQLAELLKSWKQKIVIIADNDMKRDGHWCGLDGAKHVASQLARQLRVPVATSTIPQKFKDVRELLKQQRSATNE